MFCACNPIDQPKADISFCFGVVSVKATEHSVVIDMAKPYITVDGKIYEDARFFIEYWPNEDRDNLKVADNYTDAENDHILFVISDLVPNTLYNAYIVIDGGKEYGSKRKEYAFRTIRKAEPQIKASCICNIEAKGLFATISLSNTTYMVDDAPKAIHFIRLEYKAVDGNEWIVYDYQETETTIELPETGQEYLMERTEYEYKVVCYPKDSNLDPLTAVESTFTTLDAEVAANMSLPGLKYDEAGITATVKAFEIFYDGVSSIEYNSNRPVVYKMLYRIKGDENWIEISADQTEDTFTAVIPANAIKVNSTYEVKAAITVGDTQERIYSDIAEIITTESGTMPLPEPPVGGDTSAISGIWHLTNWRGTVPPFDVYIDITATGGITLYQRISTNHWEIFQSSAYITEGVVSGTYIDGVAWRSSYSFTIDDDTMTWVDITNTEDVSVYTRSELPENMSNITTRSTQHSTSRHL